MSTKPFIVDYLLAAYRQSLLKEQNLDVVDREMQNLAEFAAFAHKHMHENRPSQITHEDEGNYGIILTNHAMVTVSPHLSVVRGSMQECGAVPVTGAATLQEMRNAALGMPPSTPGGMQDMPQIAPGQDMTQTQAGKNYKG